MVIRRNIINYMFPHLFFEHERYRNFVSGKILFSTPIEPSAAHRTKYKYKKSSCR